MALLLDVSRCTGRYDFSDDSRWCPERNTCQRYLEFINMDKTTEIPEYRSIRVSMAVEHCEHKIEHETGEQL